MSAVNNLNQIPQGVPSSQPPQNPQQPILNFNQHVQGAQASRNKPWHERAIAHLDNCERRLDEKVPNSIVQNKIDELGRAIENKFAPLKKFNDWLDKNKMGSWYKQLAMFLVKLPVKAIRNIVRLLYSIIKGVFYTAVHPMRAAVKLAKLLVRLANELTKPETWSKMGAGMLGATAGHALVTGNPFSVIGLGISAGMMVGGISIGMLKTALENEKRHRWDAVKEHLLFQLKALPESALTGFIMGLIMGGIERALSPPVSAKVDDYVNQIIQENKLPASTQWSFDPSSGKITINVPWEGKVTELVVANTPTYADFAHGNMYYEGVKIEILPTSTNVTALGKGVTFFDYIEIHDLKYPLSANIFENIAQGYPSTLIPQAASPLVGVAEGVAGGVAGSVSTLNPPIQAHSRVTDTTIR